MAKVTVLKDWGDPVMFIGDVHVPFQDPKVIALIERLMVDFKPKKLIHLGDHFDFYKLSRFSKDPGRKDDLQDEIDEGVALLRKWRRLLPEAEFHFHEGNHEDRLRKYLWTVAPELASLRGLDLASLIEAKELRMKTYGYGEGQYLTPTFLATHGNLVRVNTAKVMRERNGISGSSGHTHRAEASFHRDRGGQRVWFVNPCLCTLFPEYERFPNWQQGVTLGWFKGNRFHLQQVIVSDNAFIYDGSRYGYSN